MWVVFGELLVDWFDINKRKERVGTNCALPSILFNIEDNVDFEFGGEVFDFHPFLLFYIFRFKKKR